MNDHNDSELLIFALLLIVAACLYIVFKVIIPMVAHGG